MHSNLLLETGSALLQEDGYYILLNDAAVPEFESEAVCVRSVETLMGGTRSTEATAGAIRLTAKIMDATRQAEADSVRVNSVTLRVRA